MNVPLNIDWQQILLHLLNFVILFAILYFLLYQPVKKFMNQRREYYQKLDDTAKANLRKTEEQKREYEEKLCLVDGEIEAKKKEAYRTMSEKNEKNLLRAKEEAEKIVSDARKKAENERNALLEKARRDIADMAADATEKMFVNADTSEVYDHFLHSVKRGESNE